MPGPRMINRSTGAVVVENLSIAATFRTRLFGLQFRKSWPADAGLLLLPCRSVHTHWMRFAIDVAMLDQNGVVLQFHSHVRPWRLLTGNSHVSSVLEMLAGSMHLAPGDRLGIQSPVECRHVPQLLQISADEQIEGARGASATVRN